jgi:V8-like Glu-specific endopeptidase
MIVTEETASKIVGGTNDNADPAIVALVAQGPMGQALCTAEVISPTVLLTAAHCTLATEVGPNAIFGVVTTPSLQGATAIRVQTVHSDPMFDPMNPQNGHDVGVAILGHPLSITPIPYNTQPLPGTMVGGPVRLVGYGVSDPSAGSGAGTKRQVMATLDAFNNLLLQIGDTGTQTCNGDSGGPALAMINGVETIIGVTSYGNQNCTMGGFDTRIDTYASFISQYVTQCIPQCSGKSCGPDGCGGTCGTCPSGDTCSAAGQCLAPACMPQCSGKMCGADGCGGSCGTCPSGDTCSAAGQCLAPACMPQCSGKTCGTDGCGGSCGSCANGETCSSSGQCQMPPMNPPSNTNDQSSNPSGNQTENQPSDNGGSGSISNGTLSGGCECVSSGGRGRPFTLYLLAVMGLALGRRARSHTGLRPNAATHP